MPELETHQFGEEAIDAGIDRPLWNGLILPSPQPARLKRSAQPHRKQRTQKIVELADKPLRGRRSLQPDVVFPPHALSHLTRLKRQDTPPALGPHGSKQIRKRHVR